MTSLNLIQELREHFRSLCGDHLPTEIRYLDPQGTEVVKPITEATLDEVAFAIRELAAQSRPLYQHRSALEALYESARKQGALGADTVASLGRGFIG